MSQHDSTRTDDALRPGAGWVLIPRRSENGGPVWFLRAEDAQAALARTPRLTSYLCRLEAAGGPEAHKLPLDVQGLPT